METPRRRALGKGLEELFSTEVLDFDSLEEKIVTETPKEEIVEIKLDELRSNPYQPRKVFDEEKLRELSKSIKEHGVFQPIIVKKSIKGYEIIAGERRVKASKMAGLTEIPAIIKDFNDTQMMEIALLENLQREDLSAIEEANAYKKLKEDYNLSHDEIATKVGKSRSAITNSLRLLGLKKEIQEMLIQEIITEGHGKVLAGIEDLDLQLEIANAIRDNSLSVRETEKLVNKRLNEKDSKKDKKEEINQDLENVYKEAENELKSIFSNKVVIKHNNKNKGKITIEYYNADDFERIMKIIKSGERK
jgi:ParB family chromosome partitioning protein